MIWGLCTLICFIGASWAWARIVGPERFAERVLVAYLAIMVQILVAGYLLSALGWLAKPSAWFAAGGLCLALAIGLGMGLAPARGRLMTPLRWPGLPRIEMGGDRFSRRMALALLCALLLTGLANLWLVVATVPNNPDSLSYHLPRVAYYLQQGSLERYFANYWAQIVHPKGTAVLFAFTAVISGNREIWWQWWQYSAYWVSLLAVYALSRRLERPPLVSLIAAMVFGLLVMTILQATTTQGDLLLALCAGMAAVFVAAFARTGMRRYLALTGVSLGLLASLKFTAPATILPLGLLAGAVLVTRRPDGRAGTRWRSALTLASSFAVSLFLLAWPAGYGENLRYSGHLFGPAGVRSEHAFSWRSPGDSLLYGSMNVARYAYEFLDLDGWPNVAPFTWIDQAVQWPLDAAFEALGVDLAAPVGVHGGFTFDPAPVLRTNEGRALGGVLGFALLLPLIAWGSLSRRPQWLARSLAWAGVISFLLVAYSGPYDPFRGRYFLPSLLWTSPLVAEAWPLLVGGRIRRLVIGAILIAGCLTAVSTVVIRPDNALFTIDTAGFQRVAKASLDRPGQFTQGRLDCEPVGAFESIVPADAVVAAYLPDDACEYALFGKRLTRTVIPVRWVPIPPEADYLIYDSRLYPDGQDTDVHLGLYWYLRPLRGALKES